jgi:hypothetical protein
VFTLADVDDTEPASGNMDIWMPQAAIVVHLADTEARSAGYMIEVDSQTTVSTDLRVKAHLGPVVTFIVQPDAVRTVTYRNKYDIQEFADGGQRRTKRGPTTRSASIAWTEDGVPTHHVGGAAPTPGYALASSAANALPVATFGGTPMAMAALQETLNGGVDPVGYLGYMPTVSSSPGVTHVLRPDLFCVGWLSGETRHEARQGTNRANGGQEWSGELVTVARRSIEEIPK